MILLIRLYVLYSHSRLTSKFDPCGEKHETPIANYILNYINLKFKKSDRISAGAYEL